jgi:hypothetical protein
MAYFDYNHLEYPCTIYIVIFIMKWGILIFTILYEEHVTLFHIGCFFKFHLEESIVKAPLV